jgi:hypothetical protein
MVYIQKMILKHCTEVRFARLHACGFTTMAVINPQEKKLAKRTSVHCVTESISSNDFVANTL